jgi:hypothetical protein
MNELFKKPLVPMAFAKLYSAIGKQGVICQEAVVQFLALK